MARVTLLRRQAEDYAKQHAAYSEQLAAYNAAGEKYNQLIEGLKTPGSTPVVYKVSKEGEPDRYQLIGYGGTGPKGRTPGIVPYGPELAAVGSVEELGSPDYVPAPYNPENPTATTAPEDKWVRTGDGMMTRYSVVQTGTRVEGVGEDVREVPIYEWQATSPRAGNPLGMPVGEGAATPVQVAEVGMKEPIPDPRLARGPNFTMAEEKLLENPAYDQAGVARAEAYGVPARSEIPGMEEAGRNSPFFNLQGDDPKGIKGKGILAQVLGGYTP